MNGCTQQALPAREPLHLFYKAAYLLTTMADVEMQPKELLYCGVCSFPPEYCEFGASFKKCKAWLEEQESDLFEKLYSEDALANATSTLSIEKQEKIEKDLQKKQAKEEAKQERELKKKLQSKVVLKRIERTKRKHAISISGLEVFDIDMKKLAKTFSSKFATGCSVTKNAEKKEEIVVQGDVGDAVEAYITALLKEKGLLDIKVEQIEEKKKKAPTGPVIPPQPTVQG